MNNFDLERYLTNSKKVDLSEFDFSAAENYSLTDDEVRCLHYMMEGYGVLARRTSNPLLKTVLNRIIKDERRHFSFYYNKARAALEASRAQRLTTFLLRKFWTPVGSGVKADPDVNWMIRFVFGDSAGAEATRRIDSTIGRLPGLAWFDLLTATRSH